MNALFTTTLHFFKWKTTRGGIKNRAGPKNELSKCFLEQQYLIQLNNRIASIIELIVINEQSINRFRP